jgi:hypothetical protein
MEVVDKSVTKQMTQTSIVTVCQPKITIYKKMVPVRRSIRATNRTELDVNRSVKKWVKKPSAIVTQDSKWLVKNAEKSHHVSTL